MFTSVMDPGMDPVFFTSFTPRELVSVEAHLANMDADPNRQLLDSDLVTNSDCSEHEEELVGQPETQENAMNKMMMEALQITPKDAAVTAAELLATPNF